MVYTLEKPRLYGRKCEPTPLLEPMPPKVQTEFKEYLKLFPRGIITIDLDDSLINCADGLPCDNGIFERLSIMKDAGFLVSLNTGRTVATARKYQRMFGLHPLNLCEFGRIIDIPDQNYQIVLDEQSYADFSGLRSRLPQLFEDITPPGKPVKLKFINDDNIDVEDYMANNDNFTDCQNGDYAIIVNSSKLRLSVRAVKMVSGKPELDRTFFDVAKSCLEKIACCYPVQPPLKCKGYPETKSIVIFPDKPRNKTFIWKMLLHCLGEKMPSRKPGQPVKEGAGNSKRYIHIGNDSSDVIKDPRVEVYAVANACDQLHRHTGGKTATNGHTAGVVEILDMLIGEMGLLN